MSSNLPQPVTHVLYVIAAMLTRYFELNFHEFGEAIVVSLARNSICTPYFLEDFARFWNSIWISSDLEEEASKN
jgi:hypothetical protein